MADASLTRREWIVGARDPTTGWLSHTYTETTIDGAIFHQGTQLPAAIAHAGLFCRYPHTGWIPDVIHEDDEIKDANGSYYRVKTVTERWWLDQFDGYECALEKVKESVHADSPVTSGAWHEDIDSAITDVRYRQKTWLDTNLPAVYENNGITEADVIMMFAKPPYHLWREFADEGTDAIVYIEQAGCKARLTSDHYPYGFDESATIKVCAIDKPTITGTRLASDLEAAIREVATNHPIGSNRAITSIENSDEDTGGFTLYGRTITLSYARWNDDYVPTIPTVTYGASQANTFTFPNCTKISPPTLVNQARLDIPGRFGNILQKLGMPDFEIRLTVDLDMEPSVTSGGKTWKRPQTTQPKTDNVNWQVFSDIQFNIQKTDDYQLLNLGWGGTIKVVLDRVEPTLTGEENMLDLVFYSYSSTSETSYTDWLGLS
jgi:hypothetical protein